MGKAFKKIKKAVRKVVKPVEKVVKKAASVAVPGQGAAPKTVVQEVQAPAPAPAALVDVPTQENVETEDEAQTEAGRRKARAGGKKSLSVARSSGGGLNI